MTDKEKSQYDLLIEVLEWNIRAGTWVRLSPERALLCVDALTRAKEKLTDKAKWEPVSDTIGLVTCSKCGRQSDECSNYCPNCGADMREAE